MKSRFVYHLFIIVFYSFCTLMPFHDAFAQTQATKTSLVFDLEDKGTLPVHMAIPKCFEANIGDEFIENFESNKGAKIFFQKDVMGIGFGTGPNQWVQFYFRFDPYHGVLNKSWSIPTKSSDSLEAEADEEPTLLLYTGPSDSKLSHCGFNPEFRTEKENGLQESFCFLYSEMLTSVLNASLLRQTVEYRKLHPNQTIYPATAVSKIRCAKWTLDTLIKSIEGHFLKF